MSATRLRGGEWLAAAGAVVSLVSLFALHWYGPRFGIAGGRVDVLVRRLPPMSALTGWAAIPTLRWFVLVTAVLALGLALAQAAPRGPALAVTLDLVAMLVAGLTTILVLIRLATTGAPLRFGAVLGALAAVAVTSGAFRALRAEQGSDPGIADPEHPVELVELSVAAPDPGSGGLLN